jgi:hypothetical protein
VNSLLSSAQQIETDRLAYALAREYLFSLEVPGLSRDVIDAYRRPFEKSRPTTLAQVYLHFLVTAQNANMKPGVIGGAIGGVEKLGAVLCDFEPLAVVEMYGADAGRLLEDIADQLLRNREIRRTTRSIWPQYCHAALSGAQFLTQFSSADAFYEWIDSFNRQDEWCAALPLLLSKEVHGLGFALACDFLKEMGYTNFAKPDVHLRDIFLALSLCDPTADDYGVFKAIVRVARHCETTSYEVDKMFWLMGSGYFYGHEHIGNRGRIGSHKQAFIEFAQTRVSLRCEDAGSY